MDRGAGWRAPIELIDGEVVVVPPTGGDASLARTEALGHIGAWQRRHGTGGRLLLGVLVRVGDAFLAPDVAWWAAGREPPIGPGAIDTVPDLVIEVLSPSTRAKDLGPKRRAYLQGGVRELWLVDPAARSVTVVRQSGDSRLGEGSELTSPLLPGLAIAVGDLFA